MLAKQLCCIQTKKMYRLYRKMKNAHFSIYIFVNITCILNCIDDIEKMEINGHFSIYSIRYISVRIQ